MTLRLRPWVGLLAVLAGSPALAQVRLADEVKPGDCFRYEITLTVDGKMKVEREGRVEAIPLKAKAAHVFLERVEAIDARGGVGRALRYYQSAASEFESGPDRGKRELSADRRLIVAQRTADGSRHYSPDGPLFREELELVAEHFDTLCLPALLPGKELKPGDTWAVGPEATQHACLFGDLIKAELVGKLVEVKDGIAHFEIAGPAEGVEAGAHAKLTVSAKGKYDLASKRLVELAWEQSDVRGQGPASPASEVKATIVLKRTALAEEPKELSAAVRARVPADGKIPELATLLRYADPDGRYQFTYPRDWHVVGRTRDHLVLRLLEKGEFVAQATVTTWKKADPGHHADPEEFKKLLGQLPGWEPERVLTDGPIPTDPGRWLYRVSAQGKQDGLAVVQTFFLLAGPGGDQVAVTVLARQEKAEKVGTLDLMLVNAVEFPAGK
ncbi:MAG TPA: hypothetical protein VFG68_08945 [Fimbriiglobus sp.]|nr:hypothetical protein [Fimbriiglobus sp.]